MPEAAEVTWPRAPIACWEAGAPPKRARGGETPGWQRRLYAECRCRRSAGPRVGVRRRSDCRDRSHEHGQGGRRITHAWAPRDLQGRCGVFVAPGDARALRSAVTVLLGDPHAPSDGRAGRALVEQCHRLDPCLRPPGRRSSGETQPVATVRCWPRALNAGLSSHRAAPAGLSCLPLDHHGPGEQPDDATSSDDSTCHAD